jgi:acyl-CoA thioester hydrolase
MAVSSFLNPMIQACEPVRVRYAETDQMGFAYHGNYMPWFEMARTRLLREQGLPYRKLEEEGFFLPVIEVAVKYLKPAFYDDELGIIARLEEKPLLRIRISYEVRRGADLLCTAQTVHAFIDKEGKPVRPPPSFATRMGELFQG